MNERAQHVCYRLQPAPGRCAHRMDAAVCQIRDTTCSQPSGTEASHLPIVPVLMPTTGPGRHHKSHRKTTVGRSRSRCLRHQDNSEPSVGVFSGKRTWPSSHQNGTWDTSVQGEKAVYIGMSDGIFCARVYKSHGKMPLNISAGVHTMCYFPRQ